LLEVAFNTKIILKMWLII